MDPGEAGAFILASRRCSTPSVLVGPPVPGLLQSRAPMPACLIPLGRTLPSYILHRRPIRRPYRLDVRVHSCFVAVGAAECVDDGLDGIRGDQV